jgi:hypothetical protein
MWLPYFDTLKMDNMDDSVALGDGGMLSSLDQSVSSEPDRRYM